MYTTYAMISHAYFKTLKYLNSVKHVLCIEKLIVPYLLIFQKMHTIFCSSSILLQSLSELFGLSMLMKSIKVGLCSKEAGYEKLVLFK